MTGRCRKEIICTVLLLLTLFLMPRLNAASVSFGGEAGVTADSVIAGSGYNDYRYSQSLGFKASLPVMVLLSEHVGLKTGVAFIEKNHCYDRYVKEGSRIYHTNDLKRINGFIEVPLSFLLLLPLTPSCMISFSFGGFCGYWIYGMQEGNVLSAARETVTAVTTRTDLSNYNRLQYGLLLSAGFSMPFGRMTGVMSFEYELSLSDMNGKQKYGSYPVYNSAFICSFAVMWGLP